MNKINQVFSKRGDRKLLSLYFCAGCPTLEGTGDVIKSMARHGIMQPENYSFHEVMTIFLAVMVTDVIVLDKLKSCMLGYSPDNGFVCEITPDCVY